MVGVAALVVLSVLELPLSEAVAKSKAVGAAGAEVSTVTVKAAEALLMLPARSVAVAVMLWVPSPKVEVETLQTPLAFAEAVATCTLPSYRVTVELASAEPLTVGVAALVVLSVFELPLSEAVARSNAVGAAGAEVSMVTVSPDEAAVLPA
jgi:hypothetical protein